MLPVGCGLAVFSWTVAVITSIILCSRKKTPSIKDKNAQDTQQKKEPSKKEPSKKVEEDHPAEKRQSQAKSSKSLEKKRYSKKAKSTGSLKRDRESQKKTKKSSKHVSAKRMTKREEQDVDTEIDQKDKISDSSQVPQNTPMTDGTGKGSDEDTQKVEDKSKEPVKEHKKDLKSYEAKKDFKELDKIDLKPKVIPHNAKEERIAQGQMRGKADYPTMDDVMSDWDSVRQNTKSKLLEHKKKKKKKEETEAEDSKETVFQLRSRVNTVGADALGSGSVNVEATPAKSPAKSVKSVKSLGKPVKSPAKSKSEKSLGKSGKSPGMSEKVPEKAAADRPVAFKKSKEVADDDSKSLEADLTQSDS